ncbi:MAG: hypothetical protein ACFFD6_02510 [Candidatus Thorarchaeota archaeon]
MAHEDQSDEPADTESTLVRCGLSKIEFPEVCPVCLKEPEDLVAITIIERSQGERGDDRTYSALKRGTSRADIALEAARGATTLWVPACMKHGSANVRSDRMRIISWLSFFIMFYPILYFILALSRSLANSSVGIFEVAGLGVSLVLFLGLSLYGCFPRALERTVKVVELEYAKDRVYLDIRNPTYLKQFMQLNAMHCSRVESVISDNPEY